MIRLPLEGECLRGVRQDDDQTRLIVILRHEGSYHRVCPTLAHHTPSLPNTGNAACRSVLLETLYNAAVKSKSISTSSSIIEDDKCYTQDSLKCSSRDLEIKSQFTWPLQPSSRGEPENIGAIPTDRTLRRLSQLTNSAAAMSTRPHWWQKSRPTKTGSRPGNTGGKQRDTPLHLASRPRIQ